MTFDPDIVHSVSVSVFTLKAFVRQQNTKCNRSVDPCHYHGITHQQTAFKMNITHACQLNAGMVNTPWELVCPCARTHHHHQCTLPVRFGVPLSTLVAHPLSALVCLFPRHLWTLFGFCWHLLHNTSSSTSHTPLSGSPPSSPSVP